MVPGRGVEARVEGKTILAGNEKILLEHGIQPQAGGQTYRDQGCTLIYAAIDGRYAGFLALSDTLRAESAATIQGLSDLGVQPVLLTGDHANAAGTLRQSCPFLRSGQSACRRTS